MALVWLRVLPEADSRSVQLPADVKHRSVDGDTLLLTPGQSREVTEDEWTHLQREHADYLSNNVKRLDNEASGAKADNSKAPRQPR